MNNNPVKVIGALVCSLMSPIQRRGLILVIGLAGISLWALTGHHDPYLGEIYH